jgi:hypothetical protein
MTNKPSQGIIPKNPFGHFLNFDIFIVFEFPVPSVVLFLLFVRHPAQLVGGFFHCRGVQVDPLAPIAVEADERLLGVPVPLGLNILDGLGEFFHRVLNLGVGFLDVLQELAEVFRIEIDDGHNHLAADGSAPTPLIGFPFRIDVLFAAVHPDRAEEFLLPDQVLELGYEFSSIGVDLGDEG